MTRFSFSIAILLTLSLFCSTFSIAQSTKSFDVGLEVQAYPTGIIPGIHLEWGLSEKDGLLTRIGYNLVRHRDLGKHEDERGGGFGFTLGYRRYFKANRNGLFIGAKSDIWFNKIDWKDKIGQSAEVSGQTDITVLQPTAELGYVFNLGENGWILVPSVAFGAEINVKTKGSEVGEGAIVLIGFTLGKRF